MTTDIEINACDLRNRISIQEKTITRDSIGGAVETWEEFVKGWAAIRPLRGGELVVAQQIGAGVTHEITMRWMSGITPEMRILFNGRSFDINSALNIEERNIKLVLMCKESV